MRRDRSKGARIFHEQDRNCSQVPEAWCWICGKPIIVATLPDGIGEVHLDRALEEHGEFPLFFSADGPQVLSEPEARLAGGAAPRYARHQCLAALREGGAT